MLIKLRGWAYKHGFSGAFDMIMELIVIPIWALWMIYVLTSMGMASLHRDSVSAALMFGFAGLLCLLSPVNMSRLRRQALWNKFTVQIWGYPPPKEFTSLTDSQWKFIKPFFDTYVKTGRSGKESDDKQILNAILYTFISKRGPEHMPEAFGLNLVEKAHLHNSARQKLKRWVRSGEWYRMLTAVLGAEGLWIHSKHREQEKAQNGTELQSPTRRRRKFGDYIVAFAVVSLPGLLMAFFSPSEPLWPWDLWKVPPWNALRSLWTLVVNTWKPSDAALMAIPGSLLYDLVYVTPMLLVSYAWLYVGGLIAKVYWWRDDSPLQDPVKACNSSWASRPFLVLGLSFLSVGLLAGAACVCMIPVGIIAFIRSFL